MKGEFGGSQLKSAVSSKGKSTSGGFLVGVIFFLASFPLLFWNEGSAVKTAKALEEGQGIVVSLPAPGVDPANEGKLIHFLGQAMTEEQLKDSYTGIQVHGIRLKRMAQMFQWKENKEEKDKKIEYYYEKVWSESPINSSGFFNKSYTNPSSMPVSSEVFQASRVAVGEFELSPVLIAAISGAQPYPVTEPMYAQMPEALRNGARLAGGELYLGVSPENPQIGDIKISYILYPEQEVSVVAKQQGSHVIGYTTSNGRTLEILYTGVRSADQIFAAEQRANTIFTWVVRGGGVLMMYIGLMLTVGQVARLFSWIPLLGGMVESGIAIMAGLLALSLSFVVISVGWIFYRPVVGVGLLAVGIVFGVLLFKKAGGSAASSGDDVPPIPK